MLEAEWIHPGVCVKKKKPNAALAVASEGESSEENDADFGGFIVRPAAGLL